MTPQYAFEKGEIIWLLAPNLRAVLGEYKITRALEHDKFELENANDGTPHPGPVEGRFLSRDPFAANR